MFVCCVTEIFSKMMRVSKPELQIGGLDAEPETLEQAKKQPFRKRGLSYYKVLQNGCHSMKAHLT
ncbi:hypothetical protein Kkor_1285 [Kangiella koreensis DSM 16069]|uniref:Uncharacterized protein n=1 Tax=Kangiella koreensis (strain DSM 16069 / JCM 12317 / KCTC 12182 / SW-125) TaxID=523791 RepID=C7RBQ9_KANKD|nr:hypothetical protein Kkor_1285 [Kangiella koreensis DSM 16069]